MSTTLLPSSTSKLDAAAVADILNDKQYAMRGVRGWHNAQTPKDAKALTAAFAKRLRRKPEGLDNPPVPQVRLANRLDGCTRRRPCLTGACPRCGGALQAWGVQLTTTAFDPDDPGGEAVALSIAPPASTAVPGALAHFDMDGFLTWVLAMLEDTGLVSSAIVGLDFSMNDYSGLLAANRWHVQAYAIVRTTSRTKLREALKKQMPATATTPRPIRTRRFDGSAYGASYLLKNQFVRRVSFINDLGHRKTKKRRLYAGEHIELMLVLQRLGLHGRLGFIGLDAISEGAAS